jgi:hypothetical protein
MKNIFLLSTKKKSRLHEYRNKIFLHEKPVYVVIEYSMTNINKDLFITSDEEIKEGDFGYDFEQGIVFKCDIVAPYIVCKDSSKHISLLDNKLRRSFEVEDCKKIILTTDTKLIEDGVQAIDDTFLEWFVNNPSCEEVKIESWQTKGEWELDYKIIIPQEEFEKEKLKYAEDKINNKKALINAMYEAHKNRKKLNELESEQRCTCDDNTCDYCEEQESIQILKEAKEQATKQKTLEGAAEDFANSKKWMDGGASEWVQHIFKEGANWQAERMYSEEDMREAFKQGHKSARAMGSYNDITEQEDYNKWFEQFKKK